MGALQLFHGRFRALHFLLAVAMLWVSVPVHVLARDGGLTKNVGFKVTGQVVQIFYDLIAPSDQVYTVTVVMKKRFDKTYSYTPISVSGDVGQAVIPGENRRISWKLTDEFPNGLPGEDCFFVVDAESGSAAPGGISTTVWIIGGAAVLGGVLTAVLLSKGSTPPPPASSVFPNPPGRP